MYCLVGALVVFQAGVALHRGTHQEGREVQEVRGRLRGPLLSHVCRIQEVWPCHALPGVCHHHLSAANPL